jgi:DNA-binding NarL/FixJ family response regulator
MIHTLPLQRHTILTPAQWSHTAKELKLSKTELAIVQNVFDNQSLQVMATDLGLSISTVRTYFERLYRKTRVDSRVGLVLRVMELHL